MIIKTKIEPIVMNDKSIEALDIWGFYKKSKFLSIKHSSYFSVYEELLERFRDKELIFIEVGVLNGGSLFMWREFFGKKARIIGVDLNPLAKKWEQYGFEIYIGSQSDSSFWKDLFDKVGEVDIVLDDGGHSYEQQIVTASECIPNIKNGGILIVEDTHTSYFREFGYPSKYTFIEWTKALIDCINSRFPSIKQYPHPFRSSIHSITVYESIVSFKISRDQCIESISTTNDGISSNAVDFRNEGTGIGQIHQLRDKATTFIKKLLPAAGNINALRKVKDILIDGITYTHMKWTLRRLKKYF